MSDIHSIISDEQLSSQYRWRKQHLFILLGLSVFCTMSEMLFTFIIKGFNLIHTSNFIYTMKYLVFPLFSYAAIDIASVLLYRSRKIKNHYKNFFLSLSIVAINVVLCIVHDSFTVIYAAGIFPILLTVVYSDLQLTTSITGLTVLLQVCVSRFVHWNSYSVHDSTYFINVLIALVLELAAFTCCYFIIQSNNRIYKRIMKKQQETEKLRYKAMYDELTGLKNRAGLRSYLNEHNEPMCIAMLDIDNFKMVNDTWGHQEGDAILKMVGLCFHDFDPSVRRNIECFRYGGDEFMLVFSGWSMTDADAFCSKIQQEFASTIPQPIWNAKCRLSYGLAYGNSSTRPSDIIHEADQKLYTMKQEKKTAK